MPYITYEYYTKDFYGDTIPEESFSKFELKAQFNLDRFTFGRLKGLPTLPGEVHMCMCELAEYIFNEESQVKGNGIASESTDGYSVTYQNSKTSEQITDEMYKIANKHLCDTGLLYRGGRCYSVTK